MNDQSGMISRRRAFSLLGLTAALTLVGLSGISISSVESHARRWKAMGFGKAVLPWNWSAHVRSVAPTQAA